MVMEETLPKGDEGGDAGILEQAIVYLDGSFLSADQAKVSVFDHGLMYGDAVFDTARVYNGYLFKLDEHIDRLFSSAKGIVLTPPVGKETLRDLVVETVRRNKTMNAQVRIILTRGTGPPGLDPKKCKQPTLIISAVSVPPMLGRKPLRLLTSSVRKKSLSVDSKLKSINYMDSILAKIQASASGFDDAVMLDHNGYVAECTGANIFLVSDNSVLTPSTACCLAGVTRGTIIQLAKKMNIAVSETFLTTQDLYGADECFLTGTGIDGVVPVGEIDGRRIGDSPPGPKTKELADAYLAMVKRTDPSMFIKAL